MLRSAGTRGGTWPPHGAGTRAPHPLAILEEPDQLFAFLTRRDRGPWELSGGLALGFMATLGVFALALLSATVSPDKPVDMWVCLFPLVMLFAGTVGMALVAIPASLRHTRLEGWLVRADARVLRIDPTRLRDLPHSAALRAARPSSEDTTPRDTRLGSWLERSIPDDGVRICWTDIGDIRWTEDDLTIEKLDGQVLTVPAEHTTAEGVAALGELLLGVLKRVQAAAERTVGDAQADRAALQALSRRAGARSTDRER